MAIVVLPLLPEGPFGPFGGIRPRGLWLLVLFFTGLSFGGYLARRIFGATHGYPLAGLLAGLVSSTNVTFRMPAAGIAPNVAAEAIAIGILANCVLKLCLAVVYGTPAFRRLTGAALATMAMALVAALGVNS